MKGRPPLELVPKTVYNCQRVVGPSSQKRGLAYLWRFQCIHCGKESLRRPNQVMSGDSDSCVCRRIKSLCRDRDRDTLILKLRGEGLSFRAIGKLVKLTRQRVQQIYGRSVAEQPQAG